MSVQPVFFGDAVQRAIAALPTRFAQFAQRAAAAHPALYSALAEGQNAVDAIAALERQRRGAQLPAVEGLPDLLAAAVSAMAPADAALAANPSDPLLIEAADLTVTLALWGLQHGIPVLPAEPVVNALARQANATRDKNALAGAVHLMQALGENLGPSLAADLERSNPERPWRVLHSNRAIAAIRTEEPALMDAAFDALDAALPEECATFYAEALALALSPAIPETVRERIRSRHLKWTVPT